MPKRTLDPYSEGELSYRVARTRPGELLDTKSKMGDGKPKEPGAGLSCDLKSVRAADAMPEVAFEAVAEILAFLYRENAR